ncbi:MAG TPA: DUF1302 family protein, partial [Bacteroidales bacterium]|nr:DUF1302 family protein [Bacteroidales bacterium]
MKKFLLLSTALLIVIQQSNSQGLFESSIAGSDSLSETPVSFHGFTRSALYSGTNSQDELFLQSIYSQFALSAQVKTGKYGEAYAEVRYRRGEEFSQSVNEVNLREAYISAFLGPVTLRAGKQVYSWGVGSFLNPSDQSSPLNPTFRSPYSDDLRLGRWALQGQLQITNQSYFEATWFPYHTPSVMITEPFEFPESLQLLDPAENELKLENSGYRLRYDVRSSFLDLALSFYHGYRNNPLLLRDTVLLNLGNMNIDRIDFQKAAYVINNAGLNLTIPVGSYIFRTEAAYLDFPDNEDNPQLPFNELSYIAEIEQSGNNVTLIGGYHGKYIFNFEKTGNTNLFLSGEVPNVSDIFPPGTVPDLNQLNSYIDNQVEGFNRLYNYQNESVYHAAYLNITFSLFYNQLEFDLPGMYNFTAEEFTFMPSIT